MSELRTNRIIPRDGLTSGTGIGGGIIQIKQTIKKDQFTSTQNVASGYTDLTGLSVAITPTRSDSKVLVRAVIYNSIADNNVIYFRLLRGSTQIGGATSTAHQSGFTNVYTNNEYIMSASHNFLDSPSTTSATTYKLQWRVASGTGYLGQWKDSATNYNGSSTITAMEVSA